MYTLSLPNLALSDEFHGLGRYQLASILILMTGAFLFTILPARWTRLLALETATFLALTIVSLGLCQIFPEQTYGASVASFRVWEALQPALNLPGLLVALWLPVWVQLVPFVNRLTFHPQL